MPAPEHRPSAGPDPLRRSVSIPAGPTRLLGELTVPEGAERVVLFLHGSGSGRRSPRNTFVADRLQVHRTATLLADLLDETEAAEDARSYRYRFDMDRLTERGVALLSWAGQDRRVRSLPCGLYGASTGGAVAMNVAALRPDAIGALVLRGARSDLAAEAAPKVRAPALLIAGELDAPIRAWNAETLRLLGGPSELRIVPGASHLFEEPGALDRVAEWTDAWFAHHLSAPRR